MLDKLRKADSIIFIFTSLLTNIGLLTLYSITLTNNAIHGHLQNEFTNQLIYGFIGLVLAFLIFLIPLNYLRIKGILFVLYIITTVLLIYTLVFGVEINGVKRWINIGGTVLENGTIDGGITIQASEFAKLTLIMIVSSILSTNIQPSERKFLLFNKIKKFVSEHIHILYAIIAAALLIGLIFAQKSLSVAIINAFIFSTILLSSIKQKVRFILLCICLIGSLIISQNIFSITNEWKLLMVLILFSIYLLNVYFKFISQLYLVLTLIAGIISGSLLFNIFWNNLLQEYQRDRVEAYLSPNTNIQAEDYQQYQSILSIGSGQIFGQRFAQATDNRLLLLPEPTTDFIFAIFSYKFGFVGGLILISLYTVLIVRLYYLSDTMNDQFSSLALVGIGSMIMIQCFFNIGMNLGLLPVGGTTLPFVSAGGSSLISMMIAIGLAENIIASNRLEKTTLQRNDKILIEGWNL